MLSIVFYAFATAAVVSALMCILSKSPIASALWLVGTMFNLAGIYVILHAQFIAALQVLVYAGAVMVLFLFVIMLLNLGRSSTDLRGPAAVAAAIALVGSLAVVLLSLSGTRLSTFAPGLAGAVTQESPNVVADLAGPMFARYLIPFEVTSILLLAAIVGAVVLAKRKI